MSARPSAPWTLRCPWCEHRVIVNARGMKRDDPGSGVEAARYMQAHVSNVHGKTWTDFLAVTT